MFLLFLLFNFLLMASAKRITYKGITEEDILMKTQEYSWALDRINQKRLPLDNKFYNRKYTGKGINVYIIDTGINKNPFYNFTCVNFINDNKNCSTTNIHGTHVGSLIGSQEYGVSPGVKITNLKVLNDNGVGFNSDVIKSIDWLLLNKETGIVNMSLGGSFSKILNQKIKELHEKGFYIVVAGGNENDDACKYSPSSSEFAITVGAIDKNDKNAKFSNYGKCINIKAPGVDIPGVGGILSGTSMSSPIIASIVALKQEELKTNFKLKKKKGIVFI